MAYKVEFYGLPLPFKYGEFDESGFEDEFEAAEYAADVENHITLHHTPGFWRAGLHWILRIL